ncbi:MAG TPA: PA2779 family protein [Noviherbaspirillum sp.]|uniref:PA2779 family protein n=1 Tax=Noviherbaspirillum sp. TaxID=1926288 RepID=UPI002D4FA0CF|nr:PA2779 family protein [Noviherbaspirillum sp.]HYD96630.1 PA2779 family protein [Noviherbaspirillum sp.]
MMKTIKRAFVGTVVAAFTFVGFTQTVQAAMIGTEQVHASNAAQQQDKARIAAALDRPEVMAQLEQLGVQRADAQARVAALTDDEAATLAAKIDSLPAGGDVVGTLVLIFVILLVTDILGLTKVFPFTRSRR